ncbi:Uncharacterised protein [Legionella feeleii]|uniref:Uncharacterized protein n=1 Tax=Legionella feeleii TaxID=453 RepID=A0A2X1QSM8_9GAMM|nr:Uncharacterised protein [Legionella feeleii]SPX62095.1 Uncharacterised protein [Legionella feeleii]
MGVVQAYSWCRLQSLYFLLGEARQSPLIPPRQIAIHLAQYGLLRNGQSVVVWPGVIVPKESDIYLSTLGLLVLEFDSHLEVGR